MAVDTSATLDLRGHTITTHILYELHTALEPLRAGERVMICTDAFAAIESDLCAWSRATGNPLVAIDLAGEKWRFVVEKGMDPLPGRRMAGVISDDGLLELLSPLGFALSAALAGHQVSLFFEGPAVRVLEKGFVARLHGMGRPFSRFPRAGLEKIGHVSPQEKIEQLLALGAAIFVCGPSMDHFRVKADKLAFEGLTIAEYPTFVNELAEADFTLPL